MERLETQVSSDPGISKLQKFTSNWSGDDEDMTKLGQSTTESKSNKRKHNTVAQDP